MSGLPMTDGYAERMQRENEELAEMLRPEKVCKPMPRADRQRYNRARNELHFEGIRVRKEAR